MTMFQLVQLIRYLHLEAGAIACFFLQWRSNTLHAYKYEHIYVLKAFISIHIHNTLIQSQSN